MEIYCVKCRKKTETENLSENLTKNNRKQIKGKCKICGTNKSQFVKNSEKIDKNEEKSENLLEKLYYDPKSGFSGINNLQRKSGKSQKEVQEFLNQQDTYVLHKPAKRTFKRQKVYFSKIDEQWQSDLVEMIPYSDENDNYKYLLTCIDCFSKFAWVIPLKNKTGVETVRAFEKIFKDRKPEKIQTDKGKEYYNTHLSKFLKSENIQHFSTDSDKKASICERFNRTLKEKMWKVFTQNDDHKWVNILDDLVSNYNNSYHRSIKMTPIEASKLENSGIVYENLFPDEKPNVSSKTKFKVGDTVRITKYKKIFDKGYLPNWTTERFIIDKVFYTIPTTYELKDLAGEELTGKFYDEELAIYDKQDNIMKVEKILKKRTKNGKKEILIKWYGYPEKFNTWEPESCLIKN